MHLKHRTLLTLTALLLAPLTASHATALGGMIGGPPQAVSARILQTTTMATPATFPQHFSLENPFLSRKVALVGGRLTTVELKNKRCNKLLAPMGGEEFRLRLSHGVDAQEPDTLLTAADFEVLNLEGSAQAIVATLRNAQHGVQLKVHYTLAADKSYGHKYLEIVSQQAWTLELVDLESIAFADACQPYRAKDMMWTEKKFLPALGQPLYTSNTATFWGVEFPASWNRVEDKTIRCGYQRGVDLQPGVLYATHRAVFGVSDAPAFIKDAFLQYIDEVRAAPVALKVQYNTWFDFGGGVTQKKFLESLETLHSELVVKRGCRPLDVYVIDDAWQNSRPPRSPLADWSTGLYPVNATAFDKDMQTVRQAVEAKGSKMGLWASPACIFGARANIDVLEQAGFEVLVGGINPKNDKPRKAMSMAGPKYMAMLEQRLLELVNMGAVYFKLDGIFGDLSSRLFETKPGRGAPVMAHLLPADIEANDPRLDDPRFDETKRYYITAATERLMQIFDKMHRQNPSVRILCHNGATISPWWLLHLDVLSLVNSRDGAPGDRTEQMCYRDALYYQLTEGDRNQVPLCSFFNHEPAKDGNRFSDQTLDGFRDYLFLAVSRGTMTVELYFVVRSLKPEDYDVIAQGLKWLYHVAPAFKRSRMHGGNPLRGTGAEEEKLSLRNVNLDQVAQVYGYTGWTDSQGYVSIHNPTSGVKSYSFCLDRKFGLIPGSGPFTLSSPMVGKAKALKQLWNYGETVTVELQPREVVVLDFDRP